MPVPRRRHSKSRTHKARTHKKLVATRLVACPDCGEVTVPHRICMHCGKYKGRTYRTVVTK